MKKNIIFLRWGIVLLCILLWTTVVFFLIQKKNHHVFLEQWIHSQYTAMNLMYQTGNFTIPFDKIEIYRAFENPSIRSIKILKLPLECTQSWCFSPYSIQINSLTTDFQIQATLVYQTFDKEQQAVWPYYFVYGNYVTVKKGEEIIIDESIVYDNLSGNIVPEYLPKEYGTYIFQDPIEIYYEISPTFMLWTGAMAIVSLYEN